MNPSGQPPIISDKLHAELVIGLTRGTLTDAEAHHVAAILRSVLSMISAENTDPGMDVLDPREVEASRWRLVRDQVCESFRDYYAEGAP
ncbi:hypothetical protein [Nocardiopsis trehalosi]|uniref:hypothetical protein n=1 Tax=Nocardiopsis trehalosi TaxID=109329 RepID=UPI00083619AA|nr:hypothetical protein [Nocardiopsis trehalosi]